MQIPVINSNIIIILILMGAGFYGLLAGKQRLRILILSIYVGIVLAEQMRQIVSSSLKMLSQDEISLLLLGLPILIFGFAGLATKKNDKGSAIANIIVGFLAGGLIISSALHLLPTSEMASIDNDSFIALNLQQFHLYILGLLPIVALILGLLKGERKH